MRLVEIPIKTTSKRDPQGKSSRTLIAIERVDYYQEKEDGCLIVFQGGNSITSPWNLEQVVGKVRMAINGVI